MKEGRCPRNFGRKLWRWSVRSSPKNIWARWQKRRRRRRQHEENINTKYTKRRKCKTINEEKGKAEEEEAMKKEKKQSPDVHHAVCRTDHPKKPLPPAPHTVKTSHTKKALEELQHRWDAWLQGSPHTFVSPAFAAHNSTSTTTMTKHRRSSTETMCTKYTERCGYHWKEPFWWRRKT